MNTKDKLVGMVWGAVLILLGAAFLVTGTYTLQITDPWLGMALTGGLSLAFFASYFISGTEKWGWLFPACIFAASTLVALLTQITPAPQGGWIGAPVLLSIAVPFLVAYFLNREKNGWALIPTSIMVVLAAVTVLADRLKGELMGTFVLLMIALIFLVVYLLNRTRRWALIPFGILAVLSLIPALTTWFTGELIGAAIMFLFAVPFIVVYFTGQRRWWALIPAGIFITIGVVVLITLDSTVEALGGEPMAGQIAGAVFLFGLGLTFLTLWLLRANAPTAWAIYPAIALCIVALIPLLAGQAGEIVLPLLLIAGGALVLFFAYRKRAV